MIELGLITIILTLCACAFYWYANFKKAQQAAESLYWLATNACVSYDNGVWHQGICEGEVRAGEAIEDARMALASLPGADKNMLGFNDSTQLPF